MTFSASSGPTPLSLPPSNATYSDHFILGPFAAFQSESLALARTCTFARTTDTQGTSETEEVIYGRVGVIQNQQPAPMLIQPIQKCSHIQPALWLRTPEHRPAIALSGIGGDLEENSGPALSTCAEKNPKQGTRSVSTPNLKLLSKLSYQSAPRYLS